MLKLYNTLTNKKEEFIPLVRNEVKMYVCGPTVYDFFHIGNARSFIMADVIRRYFEYKGYDVTFVMNITDIDDKIIKKSIDGKKEYSIVAETFANAFLEDLKKLNIKPATLYPKATAHISEIISMIKSLEEKGFAYNVNGNVFYDVSKFSAYGKLSGKNLEDLESGSRVEINEEKKNPLDFSLWKKAKEGEPSWESPWGNGRPGWHIECSAMSCKHLGETFDIHAGGSDLIFPHHENEIAQSEASTGKHFVNYWMHFGFLNIDNEKMSKSLGNFFTARDVVEKYPKEVIRLFFVQTHYSGSLNYSVELLDASKKGLEKIENFLFTLKEKQKSAVDHAKKIPFSCKKYYSDFEEAMDDDFNSAKALAVIFDFIKEVNRLFVEYPQLDKPFLEKVEKFLQKTAVDVFGIASFERKEESASLENELIEILIQLRITAKAEKNFALADKIRDDLKSLGIQLLDSKEKTVYKKS
ncbi:MAG: cysteine--tRNA ligase [Ignavibacteriaceae bacterium]|jgi:cysteinyl-tRNA synthetase|nr:cysteine--tRNA ligase [Ignavibacteriaceae bacterium]